MTELERDLDMGEISGADYIMVEKEKDIVERLRAFLCDEHGEWDVAGEVLLREAADEIERLREQRDKWCKAYEGAANEKGE